VITRWRRGELGTERLASVAVSTAEVVLFGRAHLSNPNASLAGTVGITLGVIMLYGFPVSGTTHALSIVAIEQAGPRVATGGAFGPEAGAIGALARRRTTVRREPRSNCAGSVARDGRRELPFPRVGRTRSPRRRRSPGRSTRRHLDDVRGGRVVDTGELRDSHDRETVGRGRIRSLLVG
jgi:hypothetical protein